MALIRLEVTDFRNLNCVKIDPVAHGFNFFYGNNGSGKTSLLEAIYYLSRGRSFRSGIARYLVNHSATKFSIFAQIQANQTIIIPIGIERERSGEAKMRLGQESASSSELAQQVPALLINSNSYTLLDAGPEFRRRYLDWGAFYSSNEFFAVWKHYGRALKQRNAALRARASRKEVEAWSVKLIENAEKLDQLRKQFVEKLMPFLQSALSQLISLPNLKITYQPGWDESKSFQAALTDSLDKDMQVGYSQIGPHRADLKLVIEQTPVKDILSRGQQKLFVCGMIVAQGALLQQCVNRKSIYLIDDLPSELDSVSRANLVGLLAQQEAQVFLTAVERDMLADKIGTVPFRMFHVEHGNLTKEA